MKNIKKIIFNSSILLIILLMILKGGEVIEYAHRALFICYEMIIPTLFPFFVCSGILVYSGFCESLSKIFSPVMLPVFGINPSGSAAFVLGILSGYPLGAVTTCQLYQSSYLSKKEAERLLAFCNNSGPLFILCSVGIGLFSDIKTGVLLYIAHILGAITVGIVLRIFSKPVYNPQVGSIAVPEKNIGEIFSASLQNALSSILTVCGAVVFFTVAGSLIMDFIPEFSLKPVLYGLLEFASGNVVLASSDFSLAQKLILSCIITGFAGFCVHIQVLSVVAAYGLKLKTYIIGKIMHGFFSGIYAFLILKLLSSAAIKKAIIPNMSYGFFINSLLIFSAIGIILLICFIRKLHKYPNHRLRREQ